MSSGWIEFLPAEGTAGNLRSAPILADGSFAAEGVPQGRVVIRLVGVYGRAIPTGLGAVEPSTFRSFQSPIRRDITTGKPSRIDLDLAAEAQQHLSRRLETARQIHDPKG